MDNNISRMINIIDDISRFANYIQQCNQSLNLVIAEMAISLKVTFHSSLIQIGRLLSPPNNMLAKQDYFQDVISRSLLFLSF